MDKQSKQLSQVSQIDKLHLGSYYQCSIGLTCRPLTQNNSSFITYKEDFNCDILLTLLEDCEILFYGLDQIEKLAQEQGIKQLRYPIADNSVPSSEEDLHKFINQQLLPQLNNKKNIIIHCFAGLNRTGTIGACLLLEINPDINDQQAIQIIRDTRKGSISHSGQDEFITNHFQEEIMNFNIIPVLVVVFMAALGGFFCCKALNGCHSEQSIQYSKKYGQSKEN